MIMYSENDSVTVQCDLQRARVPVTYHGIVVDRVDFIDVLTSVFCRNVLSYYIVFCC